jgi:hypothetical protein
MGGDVGNPESIETNVRFASMRQIHAAIDHLHRGDFECAITLAGAAEGMLPNTDEPHFRQKVKALSTSPEIKAEGGATGPNDYINWLKHGQIERGGPRIETATISELEMIAVVWRAITKFQATYNDTTPQMQSFAEWAKSHLQQSRS